MAAWLALAFEYDGKRNDSKFLTSEQIKAPVALLKAVDVVRAETFDARAAATDMNQALEDVRSRWEQHFQNRFDDMAIRLARVSRHAGIWRRIARDLTKNYKQLHAEHKDRMELMEKSFSTDMRLRAAERFWQAKRKVIQRLADDAEQRQAMVMTFKALEHEEKASDNERIIVLNALFRPQDSATDEAVPVAALETIMSKSK